MSTSNLTETAVQQPRMSEQTAATHFDYGAERNAYEAKWTRERYDVLTGILARAPVVWRQRHARAHPSARNSSRALLHA